MTVPSFRRSECQERYPVVVTRKESSEMFRCSGVELPIYTEQSGKDTEQSGKARRPGGGEMGGR